jgi:hypothetical protein
MYGTERICFPFSSIEINNLLGDVNMPFYLYSMMIMYRVAYAKRLGHAITLANHTGLFVLPGYKQLETKYQIGVVNKGNILLVNGSYIGLIPWRCWC